MPTVAIKISNVEGARVADLAAHVGRRPTAIEGRTIVLPDNDFGILIAASAADQIQIAVIVQVCQGQ